MTQKQVASIACQYSKNECSEFLLQLWLDYHLYFDIDYHLYLDPHNKSPGYRAAETSILLKVSYSCCLPQGIIRVYNIFITKQSI